MARPAPTILHSTTLGDGNTWDILEAESYFVITYKDRPCGIRLSNAVDSAFKYKKLTYTNLGNALAQVKRLNHKFHCEDFDVMEVC